MASEIVKKAYNRGFVRPGVYVTKDANEITVDGTVGAMQAVDFLMVVDDIENRYGFLNTSDVKKTLYERLGMSGSFDRPEDRPPVLREIHKTLQAILLNLQENNFYEEETEETGT